MNIKPMLYEQWIKLNPDVEQDEIKEKCFECGGDGVIECDCCGHERDCEECDGEGVIVENSARKQYEEQLQRDKKLLAQYAAYNKSFVANC